MDTRDQTPIDLVEGGLACSAYLREQLALPGGSIKNYGELATAMSTLRVRLIAEHGETLGTIKYMEHLAQMNARAMASLG